MKKEDLKRIVDSPEMISGIYNYCDRWCERCNFTNRCATYALEQEQFADPEKDLQNEVFWEKLSEMFEITMEMILEDAEDLGIDLDDVDMTDYDAAHEKIEEATQEHYCTIASAKYHKNVTAWFENNETLLKNKEAAFEDNNRLGIPIEEVEELKDAIEVIHWYQFQIHVKIRRGLHGKLDPVEEDNDFPKDSDGSIKVALIGIDRSIAAWGKMHASFPEKEDEILDILVKLEKLRRFTEKEFPDARAFDRAGFDD